MKELMKEPMSEADKTADDMLKSLGYTKIYDNSKTSKSLIRYMNEELIDEYIILNFNLIDKSFTKFCTSIGSKFTVREIQAINKKCEELGWI